MAAAADRWIAYSPLWRLNEDVLGALGATERS